MHSDSVIQPFEAKDFHAYMTASGPRGVICVGMSDDLPNRAWEHRARLGRSFTTKYRAGRLVDFKRHDSAGSAQNREYLMKR